MKRKSLRYIEELGAYYAREDGEIVDDSGTVLTVYADGTVRVRDDWNRGKRIPAHRLIAMCFVPNPHEYTFVHFKDGNKRNRKPENLEWIPNVKKYAKAGTNLAREIQKMHEDGAKAKDIAEKLGVSTVYVYKATKKSHGAS